MFNLKLSSLKLSDYQRELSEKIIRKELSINNAIAIALYLYTLRNFLVKKSHFNSQKYWLKYVYNIK